MVDVVIEVPRGGFVKRGADGGVDFVSPLPCPFAYGSAPDYAAEDGDPADVVVLGEGLPRGARVRRPVVATVAFLDAGLRDDKWVCRAGPLRRRDRVALRAFFTLYALAKRATGRGPARFEGIRAVAVDSPSAAR